MLLHLLLDKMTTKTNNFFLHDVSILVLSIIIALVMVKSGLLSDFLLSTSSFKTFGSLVAGLFFTSIFTTAPAIATLGEISKHSSILNTAFFGSIGAVLGDLVIFRFIRDKLSEHFVELMKHEKWWRRVHHLVFKLRYFRWITFLIGGIIIASPFPDELGISLLGFSKMKTKNFIPISFIFNFIGILCIGLIARAL